MFIGYDAGRYQVRGRVGRQMTVTTDPSQGGKVVGVGGIRTRFALPREDGSVDLLAGGPDRSGENEMPQLPATPPDPAAPAEPPVEGS